MYRNVSWLTLKFSIQSRGVKEWQTTCFHHVEDLLKVHTCRGIRVFIICSKPVAKMTTNCAFLRESRLLSNDSHLLRDCELCFRRLEHATIA